MPSLKIAVPEGIRWKLHYGSEQIKDIYSQQKLYAANPTLALRRTDKSATLSWPELYIARTVRSFSVGMSGALGCPGPIYVPVPAGRSELSCQAINLSSERTEGAGYKKASLISL